jgi:rRNA-processing protein FCF1
MGANDFEGTEVLLIDGNNLLHRVAKSVDEGAQRLLIARIRATVPQTLATVMMLDGHAAAGTHRKEKVSKGFEIRHAGSITADDALLRIVHDTPVQERHEVTVVTDDRPLADRARTLGARTRRLDWLQQLLDAPRPPATKAGIGAGRPPATAFEPVDRRPWSPGRGATHKRGNPKRKAARG